VFIGAVVTVAIGVALVQASLLALISAATATIPAGLSSAEEAELRDGLTAAVMTLGMTVGISVFVAFFVVGSTFSFTVSERQRDFGLLRLVGASPGQVRNLLLGEALLLGAAGTVLGVIFASPVLRFELWMLRTMGFLPEGFAVEWRPWIVGVSVVTGTVTAVIASLMASRRAALVPPLLAVRDPGLTDNVMSGGRWIFGSLALAVGVVLVAATAANESDPLDTSMPALLVLIVALASFSPRLVPPVINMTFVCLAPVLRHSPMSELSRANILAGIRRTASTATPVIVLVGLVVGFAGTIRVVNEGTQQEALRMISGDIVVTAAEASTDELQSVPGVRAVSEEVQLDVSADTASTSNHYEGYGLAVDVGNYLQTHRMTPASGDLELLRGETVALQQSFASGLGVGLGDTVDIGIGDTQRKLRVVATFPYSLSGPRVLLPLEVLPSRPYDRRYVIELDDSVRQDEVRGQISDLAGSASSVLPLDDWLAAENEALQDMVAKFTLAVLGLVFVYIVIAIVNAVVIATAARRAEFGVMRLTGLTRQQVILVTVLESLTVVTVGIGAGLCAAGSVIAGTTIGVSVIVGVQVVAFPWELAVAVSLAAAAVVGLTTAISTYAATRQQPVLAAGDRE
jgi:putative ABC transport system permease protein